MEGRVCLRVRIPYALSALENWNCFSFGIVLLAVVHFGCRLEGFVVFVLKRSEVACFGPRCLFFAMVNVAASWKSVISSLFFGWKSVLLRCQSISRRGFGARLGWIPVGAPRFFCFWLYKKPKYAKSVFRAGPDFLEVFFLKRC